MLWLSTSGPASSTEPEGRLDSLEVRNQDLDPAAGHARAGASNRFSEDGGPPVRQVVSIDRRDHRVLERHRADRVRHARRLLEIELVRATVRHGAVGTGARADVTEDHEGGSALMPAFADVRAASFLAHRVELEFLHQAFQTQVRLGTRRAHFQPRGLGIAWSEDLEGCLNGHPSHYPASRPRGFP